MRFGSVLVVLSVWNPRRPAGRALYAVLACVSLVACAGLTPATKADLAEEILGDAEAVLQGIAAVVDRHGGTVPEAFDYVIDGIILARPLLVKYIERFAAMRTTAEQAQRMTDVRHAFDQLAYQSRGAVEPLPSHQGPVEPLPLPRFDGAGALEPLSADPAAVEYFAALRAFEDWKTAALEGDGEGQGL